MAFKGYIPAKITYVCAKTETIEEYTEDDILLYKTKVTPTFPIETGKPLDKAMSQTGLKNPKVIETENKPIKNIVIVGLEERGNGGRAYKVVIDDNYYVDMREDVILDTIFNCGIEKGGKLKGEYVWVKYGSNMKLIRTNSDMYKQFEQGSEIHALPPLNKKDIVVGGIYSTKSGNSLLYLGSFYTYDYTFAEKWHHNTVGYGVRAEFLNQELRKVKVHAFIDMPTYYYPEGKYKNCKAETLFKSKDKNSPYYFPLKKSLSNFIKHEGTIDFSGIDIVKEIVTLTDAYNRKDSKQIAELYKGDKDYKKDGLNPYLKNRYVGHLCLGVNAPNMHPDVAIFNVPVVK